MIYLDNAATTLKKPISVRHSVNECIKKYCANPGRSTHSLSLYASEEVFSARESVCDLLNTPSPENVIFTLNATYALNIAIKGLIKEKCHILLSDLEHNSVLRPIKKLEKDIGISYSFFSSFATSISEEIERHIRSDTKFIVSTLASNVTGKEIPIKTLSEIAKKHNIKLIIDASQYIGHKKIDLSATPCSALCAPAHKALFGISGLGFVVFSEKIIVQTLIEGGSGSNSLSLEMPDFLPERLEGGTLPLPAIVGLKEGINYILRTGYEEINEKSEKLTALCAEMILSVKNMILYGKNLGIVAFNMKGISSEALADKLNDYGICVRGGFQCAPLAHKAIGTYDNGAVRASLSYFSKEKELYKLYRSLKKIESDIER